MLLVMTWGLPLPGFEHPTASDANVLTDCASTAVTRFIAKYLSSDRSFRIVFLWNMMNKVWSSSKVSERNLDNYYNKWLCLTIYSARINIEGENLKCENGWFFYETFTYIKC